MKYPVFVPSSSTLFIMFVVNTISIIPEVLESAVLNFTSAWTLFVAGSGLTEKMISYVEAAAPFDIYKLLSS